MQFDGEMPDLDMIGVLEGTDKSSAITFGWDYLRHYQRLFSPWRNQPINMIEIGIARGNSLTVWKTFFPKAQIVGIDINPDCSKYTSDRISVEIGSQIDSHFLMRIYEKHPPQIVIDDGSHQAQHIVYTFENTFRHLLPGGIYVVEDTGFHFGEGNHHWIGDGSVLIQDYFGELAQDRMENGRLRDNLSNERKYILDQIDEVIFIGCAIIIRKRDHRDMNSALAFADAYIAEHGTSWTYLVRLGGFILRHNGPLDRALELARQAVSLGGERPAPTALIFLVNVLQRNGLLGEAATVAAAGAQKYPRQAGLWQGLADVERRRKNAGAAAEALRKAVVLRPNVVSLRRELSRLLEECADLPGALAEATKAVELTEGHPSQESFVHHVTELRERLAETGS
jgi:hypothetical protein